MTKKEFFDLVQKFEKGQCTPSEENLLYKYCEEVQTKGYVLSNKEQTRVRVLKRVLRSIDNPTVKKSKPRGRTIWYAASIFLVLLTCGYIFTLTSNNQDDPIPPNAITLEHEDGRIEILTEDLSRNILDEQGNVVGKKQGNQLTYDEVDSKGELVYNTLTVPYGKTFQLELSDGTKVHLNAGSSIKYPIQFLEGRNREVFVEGEAYLDVAHDTDHPFWVSTENMRVEVLGTQFNVNAYPEDEISEVVLVEGSVSLSTLDSIGPERPVLMEPGYKTSFDKAKQEFTAKPVITGIYTSWMHGELVFRNMTFKNIMKKLERHYDITIINNDKALSDKPFNASFANEPIELVLEDFKRNYSMEYNINGTTITIE